MIILYEFVDFIEVVRIKMFALNTEVSLFSSSRFPKREKTDLLNNLQKLVQSIMIT